MLGTHSSLIVLGDLVDQYQSICLYFKSAQCLKSNSFCIWVHKATQHQATTSAPAIITLLAAHLTAKLKFHILVFNVFLLLKHTAPFC